MIGQNKIDEIIQQYISSGQILYETTLNGDSKTGNKEWEKLVKNFKELENDRSLAELSLPTLLTNDNIRVRMTAAHHCISLGIKTKESLGVFQRIASDDKNGIFAFNAEMALKAWAEQGYLIVYQGQEIHCHAKAHQGEQ